MTTVSGSAQEMVAAELLALQKQLIFTSMCSSGSSFKYRRFLGKKGIEE